MESSRQDATREATLYSGLRKRQQAHRLQRNLREADARKARPGAADPFELREARNSAWLQKHTRLSSSPRVETQRASQIRTSRQSRQDA